MRRRTLHEAELDITAIKLQVITMLSTIMTDLNFSNKEVDIVADDKHVSTNIKNDFALLSFSSIDVIIDDIDEITDRLTEQLKNAFSPSLSGIPPYAAYVDNINKLVVGVPITNVSLENSTLVTEAMSKTDANKVMTTLQGSDSANVQLILAKYLNTPLTVCYSKILSIVGDAKASNQVLLNYVDAVCRKN